MSASGNQRAELVRKMVETAPPGASLDAATQHRLVELTRALVTASPESRVEFDRYLSVIHRSIVVPQDRLSHEISGRTVLVTGASGCIGSALLAQLAQLGPARIIGVDLVPPSSPVAIEHRQLDICDRAAFVDVVRDTSPNIVFHLAAQRDPGLAERRVLETIRTNILGTRSVIDACAELAVPRLVFASTGKALRFYTREVYAASKRIAEFLVSDAASRRLVRASAVRFTHVVDNAIVLDNFRRACHRNELVRVHSADAAFYAQSALEAAQLLLTASVAPCTDALDLLAIRNLDWPLHTLDLAIGVIATEGTAPLHVAGYDAGYAEQQYQGLYDPAVCGEVSPLLNALEGAYVLDSPSPDVDRVRRRVQLRAPMWQRLAELEVACEARADSDRLRGLLDTVSRELLEVSLELAPAETLDSIVRITERERQEMTDANRWVDDRVRWWAAQRAAMHGGAQVAATCRARA
jgi:dTDP-4-dehydrorhamnose reductase